MRSHFEHDFFGCPPFPPTFGPCSRGFGPGDREFGPRGRGFGPGDREFGPCGRDFGPDNREFGPWGRGFGPGDRGFGPWGRGLGASGRGRPELFGFGRPGCKLHRLPGCNQSCQRPHHRPEHDRERSPSPTPREGDHDKRPTAAEDNQQGGHGSPVNDYPEQTRCEHQGPSGCNQSRHGHGFGGHRLCGGGPMRGNHHHHWPGPSHHGFGPRPGPGEFFDWFSFGSDHPGPHSDRRFGHRRPSPYDRLWGHFASRDCGDCHGRPGCSGNKDNQECKKKKSGRKENESCCSRNKDQNASGDTVLVQRIIVERAPTRPQSI